MIFTYFILDVETTYTFAGRQHECLFHSPYDARMIHLYELCESLSFIRIARPVCETTLRENADVFLLHFDYIVNQLDKVAWRSLLCPSLIYSDGQYILFYSLTSCEVIKCTLLSMRNIMSSLRNDSLGGVKCFHN